MNLCLASVHGTITLRDSAPSMFLLMKKYILLCLFQTNECFCHCSLVEKTASMRRIQSSAEKTIGPGLHKAVSVFWCLILRVHLKLPSFVTTAFLNESILPHYYP